MCFHISHKEEMKFAIPALMWRELSYKSIWVRSKTSPCHNAGNNPQQKRLPTENAGPREVVNFYSTSLLKRQSSFSPFCTDTLPNLTSSPKCLSCKQVFKRRIGHWEMATSLENLQKWRTYALCNIGSIENCLCSSSTGPEVAVYPLWKHGKPTGPWSPSNT